MRAADLFPLMDTLLYLVARAFITVLQALPLAWVVRVGRAAGALAWRLDARHRQVALHNLELCFGAEKSPQELRSIAQENFRRIGENFASAMRIAAMSDAEIQSVLTVKHADRVVAFNPDAGHRTIVAAIGHFGNFELYAHIRLLLPGYTFAATYRGLRQPGLNRLMQELRAKSGCLFFERREDMAALKAAMHQSNLMVGLLVDQHAGDRGARLPFFGHDCSTSVAPAVFALRYHCPLVPAICYRTAPGRWCIEIGEEIPTRENGRPRSTQAISAEMNRAFEVAIRRDPANWFWVHNRWKPGRWRSDRAANVDGRETKAPA